MSSLAVERANLAKSDLDIAEGERRIQDQTCLVERLRRNGAATDTAEQLLHNLQQTLTVWKTHRDLILQEIKRLEQAPAC